jgi:hypothetical protein
MMRRVAVVLILSLLAIDAAMSKEIAICGASDGYYYFPDAGLLAQSSPKDTGKWIADAVSPGRFTLSSVGDKLDLLYTDASGVVASMTNDGAQVIQVGRTEQALAVIIVHPGTMVETYTFVQSRNGAEAIWSSNKYGAPILKISAFHAPCSFLDLLQAQQRKAPSGRNRFYPRWPVAGSKSLIITA